MMLNDRIVGDMKDAMREGDRLRLETLRMLRASLIELQKSGERVTPERELDVVIQQAKRRHDAAEQYRAAGRADLAEREESELGIIETYLPRKLTDEEIARQLKTIITETGSTSIADFKIVMPLAMAAMKGRASGATISAILKALLTSGEAA